MTNSPLYHQATRGRQTVGVPAWWFGAPIIAFLYSLATPRLLPEVVAIPEPLSAFAAPVRWLVGLVLGVLLLSLWQVARWLRARQVH